MTTLTAFFRNCFADRQISQARLLAYTTDHLERLKAANLPDMAARVTATEAALASVRATTVADESKLGVRKGRKQSKGSFRRGLGRRLGKIQAAVQAVFGVDGPEVREFFPEGRYGFTKCTDDLLAARLAALAGALTARAAELGPETVAEGAALQSEWAKVYAASEAVSGEKAETEVNARSAREALQRELQANVLSLALLYPGQPEKLAVFAQESLLRRKRNG